MMPTQMTTAPKQKSLPRGVRNNNPGYIRHSAALWLGRSKLQPDKSFVSFTSAEYGIRAMARILINYQKRYNLKTIEKMISRWAPPNENNTAVYIAAVSRSVGVAKNKEINLAGNTPLFLRLVQAIINHENGNPKVYGRAE